jgi:hypothetical protein
MFGKPTSTLQKRKKKAQAARTPARKKHSQPFSLPTPVTDTRKGGAAEGDVEEEEDYELTDEEDRDSNTTEDGIYWVHCSAT